MTTAQLGQHVSHLRASLAGKRQSLHDLASASRRLADRISEETSPDPLLNSSLQRHNNDRSRLQTEIAHLAEALNAAQAELERRPHPTHQESQPGRREDRQRPVTGVMASPPHPPRPVPPIQSGPVPGL